jgi:hypothetical protein
VLGEMSLPNLPHLHLLLNHFPTVGMVIGLGLFLISLLGKSEDLRKASLVVFLGIALLTLPTYVTGNAAQEVICQGAAKAPCDNPGVSKALIQTHEGAALWAFTLMQILGAFAWLGLWQLRRLAHVPRWNLTIILLLSLVSFAAMARTANIGGEIRHPEIGHQADTTEKGVARQVGSFILSVRWGWPACETLHFIGLCLLFGVAAIVDLRMLGLIKGVSFAALHRLLPWAVLGFGVNLVTGMLFFVASWDVNHYATNIAFQWKLIMILLAGVNVLYFTIFDEPWALGPKDDAPLTAKVVAATAMVLVIGVIYCGRMLPFLGNSF